ncbi:MAG TPA: hypothetical protein PLW34_07035 [Termitinemataceae bacterium]|nr:hypothetical protein [Termitinemataceae bacterium]HOM24316.1 hypothetical protein [Termitinemataceae bacterium]HPQ00656.1 hypothetical protein [Termitinemataceae bacterium]
MSVLKNHPLLYPQGIKGHRLSAITIQNLRKELSVWPLSLFTSLREFPSRRIYCPISLRFPYLIDSLFHPFYPRAPVPHR